MKNKKVINLMVFIFSIVFAFFISFKIYEVKADSGFDSSWDSGSSYDSGSSWDSDSSWSSRDNSSHYSSSSNSKVANTVFYIIFLICIIFSIFDLIHRLRTPLFAKNNRYVSLHYKMNNEEIKSFLGEKFDLTTFYEEIFAIYKNIQIAWMDIDIEKVRNILSDEMFNTYKMQLETLKVKNQKNMIEDINLVDVYITNIYQKDNKDVIDVIMKVTCRDYLIDNSNGNVLRGDKNKVWNYEYKLSYMRTNISNELNYCPNCGAKLESGSSVKCSYCNAVINKETNKFILIDKKMLNQR